MEGMMKGVWLGRLTPIGRVMYAIPYMRLLLNKVCPCIINKKPVDTFWCTWEKAPEGKLKGQSAEITYYDNWG